MVEPKISAFLAVGSHAPFSPLSVRRIGLASRDFTKAISLSKRSAVITGQSGPYAKNGSFSSCQRVIDLKFLKCETDSLSIVSSAVSRLPSDNSLYQPAW